MKKNLLMLLAGVLAVLPLGVFAQFSLVDFNSDQCISQVSDDVTTYTCEVKLTKSASDDIANLKVAYTSWGEAVSSVTCKTNTDTNYTATADTKSGSTTCTFARKDSTKDEGTSLTVGYLVYTIDNVKFNQLTDAGKDKASVCGLKQAIVGNVPTGAFAPYTILAVLALGSAAIYVATKNKNAMYRI